MYFGQFDLGDDRLQSNDDGGIPWIRRWRQADIDAGMSRLKSAGVLHGQTNYPVSRRYVCFCGLISLEVLG